MECEQCGSETGEDWKTLCKSCYKVSKGYITQAQADKIREKESKFWELVGDRGSDLFVDDEYGAYKPFYHLPEGYKRGKTYDWCWDWAPWMHITAWKRKGFPDIFSVLIEGVCRDYEFYTIDRRIFPEKSNYVPGMGAYCGWGYSCH